MDNKERVISSRSTTKKGQKNSKSIKLKKVIFLGIVLMIGLSIVNSLSGGGYISLMRDDPNGTNSAEMVSHFIKTEYDRQLAENGHADIKRIISSAKKMDKRLTINYTKEKNAFTKKTSGFNVWIGIEYENVSQTLNSLYLEQGKGE